MGSAILQKAVVFQGGKRVFVSAVLLVLALLSLSAAAGKSEPARAYYRYIDDKGVKVINSQIPPEYAQGGYEVLSSHGEVIRVVEAAPSADEAEDAERLRKEKVELQQWDEELRRRYSHVSDIEAAKKRKLAQVQTSIKILESNIYNLKAQIATQQSRAAESERMGQNVPAPILKTLLGLEEELKLTVEQLLQRQLQYDQIVEKYEKDKQRFQVIRPEVK